MRRAYFTDRQVAVNFADRIDDTVGDVFASYVRKCKNGWKVIWKPRPDDLGWW